MANDYKDPVRRWNHKLAFIGNFDADFSHPLTQRRLLARFKEAGTEVVCATTARSPHNDELLKKSGFECLLIGEDGHSSNMGTRLWRRVYTRALKPRVFTDSPFTFCCGVTYFCRDGKRYDRGYAGSYSKPGSIKIYDDDTKPSEKSLPKGQVLIPLAPGFWASGYPPSMSTI